MNPVLTLCLTTVLAMFVSVYSLRRTLQEVFANKSGKERWPELLWNFVTLLSLFVWAPSLSLLIFG